MSQSLKARLQWAMDPFVNGQTFKGVSKTNREIAALREKQLGNELIGDVSNNQWTTKLGEHLVRDVLEIQGQNPRRPRKIDGYSPDWETDQYIVEVKTRSWCTTGTAGEKVLGVPSKYCDIPLLYGKPLLIVAVGYQEWELRHGQTRYFGKDIKPRIQQQLDMWKSWEITFLPFSELYCEMY
jgi:hypothetical protein|tara:strand:- start:5240 stop:5785 length:546 start_codon:yes stop_codon:yes gene_type:complete